MKALANRHRARLTALILMVLVGSMLALYPPALSPVAAVDGVADHPARYSACIGPATSSAGFVDMVNHTFEEEVNCLAYYGIAKGTTVTTFSPNDTIKRRQMALFLSRAAVVAGIDLPVPQDQGFADVAVLSTTTGNAINQLVELGIMDGVTVREFRPDQWVTRQEMAAYLDAFLQYAPPAPGDFDIAGIEPDDNVFRDLDQVGAFAYEATRRIYELGITKGATANTFEPDASVTRGQMAAFITRTLAHTNVRPAGISIQADLSQVQQPGGEIEVMVSVRDGSFAPVEDELVDVFVTYDPEEDFDQDGRCTSSVMALGIGTACEIDPEDFIGESGNTRLTVAPRSEPGIIWAWSGAEGSSFDLDNLDRYFIPLDEVKLISAIKVTDDLKANAELVPFGNRVNFTFQLVDDEGGLVSHEGVEIDLTIRIRGTDNRTRTTRETITTNQSGEAVWSHQAFSDTSTSPGRNHRLDLDASADYPFQDESSSRLIIPPSGQPDQVLFWSDEAPRPSKLIVSYPAGNYLIASDEGSGVLNRVTATLTDQYGNPVADETITFYSDDSDGLSDGLRRATNRQGEASLTYRRDTEDTGVERIRAEAEDGSPRSTTARFYWARKAEDDDMGGGRVVATDLGSRLIVALTSGDDVIALGYDQNDHFFLRTSSQESWESVTIGTFEEALGGADDHLTFEVNDVSFSEVNIFRLTNPS